MSAKRKDAYPYRSRSPSPGAVTRKKACVFKGAAGSFGGLFSYETCEISTMTMNIHHAFVSANATFRGVRWLRNVPCESGKIMASSTSNYVAMNSSCVFHATHDGSPSVLMPTVTARTKIGNVHLGYGHRGVGFLQPEKNCTVDEATWVLPVRYPDLEMFGARRDAEGVVRITFVPDLKVEFDGEDMEAKMIDEPPIQDHF